MGIKIAGENIEVFGDFFDRSIGDQLGQDLKKLKQQYAKEVIEDDFMFKGFDVEVEQQENGQMMVIATKH